jgi:hypothetical protein
MNTMVRSKSAGAPHPIYNSQFLCDNNNKLRTQREGKITGRQVAACGIGGEHGEGR